MASDTIERHGSQSKQSVPVLQSGKSPSVSHVPSNLEEHTSFTTSHVSVLMLPVSVQFVDPNANVVPSKTPVLPLSIQQKSGRTSAICTVVHVPKGVCVMASIPSQYAQDGSDEHDEHEFPCKKKQGSQSIQSVLLGQNNPASHSPSKRKSHESNCKSDTEHDRDPSTTWVFSTTPLDDDDLDATAGDDAIIVDDRYIRKSSFSGTLIDTASIFDDVVSDDIMAIVTIVRMFMVNGLICFELVLLTNGTLLIEPSVIRIMVANLKNNCIYGIQF